VNSAQATQFRIWATQTLREFIVKGFILDDERLKLNKRFGDDFDELSKRTRRDVVGLPGVVVVAPGILRLSSGLRLMR
jgi:hypothetical protein